MFLIISFNKQHQVISNLELVKDMSAVEEFLQLFNYVHDHTYDYQCRSTTDSNSIVRVCKDKNEELYDDTEKEEAERTYVIDLNKCVDFFNCTTYDFDK